MAAMNCNEVAIEKGSKLLVTVEEALANVIMVALMSGAKTFRGILMESNLRDGPHGVTFNRAQIEADNRPPKSPEVLLIDPNHEGSKPGISSLPLRHTYMLDPDAVDPKLLPPPPKKEVIKPIRKKEVVRAMRLRPRKVLCSNCKKGIHDSNTKENESEVKKERDEGGGSGAPQNQIPKKKAEPVQDPIPMKKAKQDDTSQPLKIVPKLKISIAKPKGGGEVMEIAPRTSLTPEEPTEQNDPVKNSPTTALTHQEYRKMKKALKKARLKEKLQTTGEGVEGREPSTKTHHKKSKHSKHKLKRKHKYKDVDISATSEKRNQDNFSFNNDSNDEKNSAEYSGSQNQSQTLDGDDDRINAMHISNADEFHIRKSVVRLTKLNFDEAQNHPPIANPTNHDSNSRDSAQLENHDDSNSNSNSLSSTDSFKENQDAGQDQRRSSPHPYHVEVSDISDPEDDGAPVADPVAPSLTYAPLAVAPPSIQRLYSPADSQTSSPAPPDLQAITPPPPPAMLPPLNATVPLGVVPAGASQPPAANAALMMRILTKSVVTCQLSDGRIMSCGDIMWGKIHGFPWWPGRIVNITQSIKETGVVITHMAHVSWFGSSTMSYMDCTELYPFLQYYKLRYNKKKKGPYKVAIKQATDAAQQLLLGSAGSAAPGGAPPPPGPDDDDSEDDDDAEETELYHSMDGLHSLGKENLQSIDDHHNNQDSFHDNEHDDDEDDLKKLEDDETSSELGHQVHDEIDTLNQQLENYSMQINQDIALEMLDD